MSTDYGLKLAQQMHPLVRPLPWPPDQPIAEIHKNADGKYFVHLFAVTCTSVVVGGLSRVRSEENWYRYNAEDMRVELFNTLDDASDAYITYCKRNERKIGKERLSENESIGVVKEYF